MSLYKGSCPESPVRWGVLLTAYYRLNPNLTAHPGNPVELILAVLWFTWLISSMLAYWGAQRMAVRMLVIFGCAWLLFVILSSLGEGLPTLFMQSLLTIPFFGMAWLAKRMPRVTGALLLVAGLGLLRHEVDEPEPR